MTSLRPVSHAHLPDNWTLQNAGEFLHRGLDGDTTNELGFSPDGADFHYAEKSADVMRLEALCQTLHHAVFADTLCVDADFAEAWQEFAALRVLQDERLLVTKLLLENGSNVAKRWSRSCVPVREYAANTKRIGSALKPTKSPRTNSYLSLCGAALECWRVRITSD